jgi:hypothetical protein
MARNRTSNGLLNPASFALVAMAWVNVGSLHAEDFKTLKGHSEIKRSAPKGSYNFVESVEGDARVMIRNAAKVDFYTSPTWAFHDGSKIDGDAKVLLEAQELTFNGKIDGHALVLIIIPKGGKVVFKQKIDGHAKVFWCTAAVGDPRPDPRPAAVNGTATFEEVSLEQMNSMIREHMPKD